MARIYVDTDKATVRRTAATRAAAPEPLAIEHGESEQTFAAEPAMIELSPQAQPQ